MKNLPEVAVPVSFSAQSPQMENLPPDMLDTFANQALFTVAALFSPPGLTATTTEGSHYLGSEETQAVVHLALFAAGAQTLLGKADFRRLESKARALVAGSGHGPTQEYAEFVLRLALSRAREIGMFGRDHSRDRIELVADTAVIVQHRLVEPLPGTTLARQVSVPRRLATCAALFSGENLHKVTRDEQAVAYLALYAGGARIALTVPQFRTLEKRVKHYFSGLSADAWNNSPWAGSARFALSQARRRARRSSLI